MPEATPGAGQELPLEPLDRISPSQYSWLRECSLRGVWSKTSLPLLPVSPKARVGTIVHQIMEDVSSGELNPREEKLFRDRWDSLIEEIEREMSSSWLSERFVPLSRSVPSLEVMYYQTLRRAEELHEKKGKSKGTGAAEAEKWVESSDGTVGGFIDRVIKTGSSVTLLDYKSGSLYSSDSDSSSGDLKENYKVQMKLYAALYEDMKGTWPDSLRLVGLDGTSEQIEYTAEEGVRLLEEAGELLQSLNDRVLAVQEGEYRPAALAQPDPETCSFCDFRPSCRAYWESREDSTSDDLLSDLAGRLTGLEDGSSGEFTLRLVDSPDEAEKVVHRIKPGMVQEASTGEFDVGDHVELYNLYRQSPDVYRSTSYTAVYPQW